MYKDQNSRPNQEIMWDSKISDVQKAFMRNNNNSQNINNQNSQMQAKGAFFNKNVSSLARNVKKSVK